jgi:hypothetical protein
MLVASTTYIYCIVPIPKLILASKIVIQSSITAKNLQKVTISSFETTNSETRTNTIKFYNLLETALDTKN